MCLIYTKIKNYKYSGWKKKEKILKKHTPLNEELMKPDINFIDERIKKIEKEENFFSKFLNIFK